MFKLFSIFITSFLCLSISANAGTVRCGNLNQVTKILSEKHQEQMIFSGAVINPNILVIVTRAKNGRWTLLTVGKNKQACLALFGKSSKHLPILE